MDLLEMKFFLNGVDLGPAFVNFSCNGLYPALSLNVRQCLRVNFGQERFIYPPTLVDGLPFRAVIEAMKLSSVSGRDLEKKKALPSSTDLIRNTSTALKSEDSKFENVSPSQATYSSSHILPNDMITASHDQQHGGGGSRVGGVRLGRTGEIPPDEDRNPTERIIPTDSAMEDDSSAIAASRRAAGEDGEGNEVDSLFGR